MYVAHAHVPVDGRPGAGPADRHVSQALLTDPLEARIDPAVAHVDRVIAWVAARQHGAITVEQLVELGLRRGAVAHRVRRGMLQPVHRGVYMFGLAPASLATRAHAALLAAGDGARVSHQTALALLGVLDATSAGPVHVTTPARRVRIAGVRAHEGGRVGPDDVCLIDGTRASSPARALVEVAGELSPRALADAVERAQIMRLVTRGKLAAANVRAGRRAGSRAIGALVAERQFTRSRAERLLLRLVRAAELPEPVFNAVVAGWECDALWRAERVALEFDSYTFHATRQAFERDRRKTATLQRRGHLVLRATWDELHGRSHALVARVAEALATSGGAPAARDGVGS